MHVMQTSFIVYIVYYLIQTRTLPFYKILKRKFNSNEKLTQLMKSQSSILVNYKCFTIIIMLNLCCYFSIFFFGNNKIENIAFSEETMQEQKNIKLCFFSSSKILSTHSSSVFSLFCDKINTFGIYKLVLCSTKTQPFCKSILVKF